MRACLTSLAILFSNFAACHVSNLAESALSCNPGWGMYSDAPTDTQIGGDEIVVAVSAVCLPGSLSLF